MTHSPHHPAARLALLAPLALTVGLAQAQTSFPEAKSIKPTSDSFYVAPDAGTLAAARPGQVLRYRAIPINTYSGEAASGYQLMYRTSDGRDQATAAVTTVLIPKNPPLTNRKLLSYQAFYDSLTIDCSPSRLIITGSLFEKGNVRPALKAGHVVVMSDYEGLQSQWIAGANTAHGVLDGIRAAINFNKTGLNAQSAVAMQGFSGGGHATAWAAEVAPSYAPELNIVAAAAGGVPVNPINVAKRVEGTFFSSVYFGAVVGLSRAYPELDVSKYANAAGLAMVKDMGTRCLLGSFQGQPDMLFKYMFQKGSKYLKDANFLELPEMQAINRENTLGQATPKAPMYIYHGLQDEIMVTADVDAWVKGYCAAGVKVQYNRALVGDHLSLAVNPAGATNYVLDALAGKTPPENCK